MTKEDLRKAWLTSALIGGAVLAAILLYVLIVEVSARYIGFSPPVTGAGAAAVKYGLYFLGAASVMSVKHVRRALDARGNSGRPAAAMVARYAAAAALGEVPALAGLLVFFSTGGYWDFYLLAAFSAVMETVYFPRYGDWERRARAEYGLDV